MNNWFKFCIYSFLFWIITHGCIIQKRMYILIGPRNGQKLLPPSWSHVWYIKTQNKWQWDEIQECIEVLDNLFKQPEIKKNREIKSNSFFREIEKQILKKWFKKRKYILDSAVKSWNSIPKKCICHRYMRKMQNIAIFWGLEREDHFLEIRGFYLRKLSRVKWFKIYHIFGE